MVRTLSWILFWSVQVILVNGLSAQQVDPQATVTPAPVEELVYARPFALSKGYRWSYVFDEPETDIGMIVVLRVDPDLVVPRSERGPILFAGDRMLQALNFGHTSGHVIGLIPGATDLAETPIWFGSILPTERVTPQAIQAERVKAEEAGIGLFSAEQIQEATQPAIVAPDLQTLLRGELADLVLEYAPGERGLARKWRLPEATNEPGKPLGRVQELE